jgi:hypothetical protein
MQMPRGRQPKYKSTPPAAEQQQRCHGQRLTAAALEKARDIAARGKHSRRTGSHTHASRAAVP